jgi:trans-2,3-dihydro-3-hydroxyanthranilate isomerase
LEFQFYVVDVFTDKQFQGNQLAVFPSATGISDENMQKIAKEFNYSETAFVTHTEDKNILNVRIFTPESEIDFAGHPNIGTAMLLARIGKLTDEKQIQIVFREKVGDVPITINFDNFKPISAELSVAKLPEEKEVLPSLEQISKVISLEATDISQPVAFSCGLPFLFIPVLSLEKIKQANLNHDEWKKQISDSDVPQLFLFTRETENPDYDFHARMFAPALGISEDPATGSAVAALSGYISEFLEKDDGEFTYVVEQGFEINRPSIIEMSFSQKNQRIESVKIMGNAIIFSEGKMSL